MTKNPAFRTRPRFAAPALPTLFALTLLGSVACSGGNSPTAPTMSSQAPQNIAAASASLVNQARGSAALNGLVFDPALCEVAQQYSEKMRNEGTMSHVGSDGSTVAQRLAAYGVHYTMAGENLATVQGGDPAQAAHKGFMGSASHRANILEARFTAVGVGVATDGESYWLTQIYIRD